LNESGDLSGSEVFRLFKCALKEYDALIGAIAEKLCHGMKDFDASRAKRTI
jgi:hypothetical protein